MSRTVAGARGTESISTGSALAEPMAGSSRLTDVFPNRAFLTRVDADTNPAHGTAPLARDLVAHMSLGVVNLDKPSGPSSHQVVAWLKLALDIEKAGHGGTLDPNVTGVLPIALLDATRVIKTLLEAPKEYIAVVELHRDVEEAAFREAIMRFVGPVYQIPPLKSAVKRELRIRTIYELEILEVEKRRALFRVSCEAGTYIRKLCQDIGRVLGVGGHMLDLRRSRTGPWTEADSVTMHDVRDAFEEFRESGDESGLRRVIRPVEELVAHLPAIVVRDTAVDAVCHGAYLALPGVVAVDKDLRAGGLAAVFSLKGELVATGTPLLDAADVMTAEDGLVFETKRVIMDPGTYPKGWRASPEAAAQ